MDVSSHNGEVSPPLSAADPSATPAAEDDDESASIKLGLSQLPADVTVELYQCPVCRLNNAGKVSCHGIGMFL